MPDIAIIWNPVYGEGDWARPDQETAAGGDLVAAVLVSLFTDRRATPEFVLTDGTTDRRGCWTDSLDDEPIGSRLWQLDRARRDQATLHRARDFCAEALAWLKRDGLATKIDVLTFWAGRVAMGIRVTIELSATPAATIDVTLPFPTPGGR